MSSKLFRLAAGTTATPIEWRETGPVAALVDAGATTHDPERPPEQSEAHWRKAVEEARSAAYREGEAAGRERAAAEVRPLIDRLAHAVEELALLRPKLRKEAETDMLRLALAVARRILGREMAVDPEALHGIALAALEKLGSQEIYRVKVHPSLAAPLRAALERTPGRAGVEIVPDGAREPGTVLFETARGDLDASVGTQLEEIERGLADCLRRRS
jgi:flagellar assembly protein FliH